MKEKLFNLLMNISDWLRLLALKLAMNNHGVWNAKRIKRIISD